MNILPTAPANSTQAPFNLNDPEQVLAVRKSALALLLKKNASDHITQSIARHKIVTDAVWESKQGLTPQQAFDALGTDGVKCCQAHAALTTYLEALEQILEFSFGLTGPTAPLQYNEDGTVTVLD